MVMITGETGCLGNPGFLGTPKTHVCVASSQPLLPSLVHWPRQDSLFVLSNSVMQLLWVALSHRARVHVCLFSGASYPALPSCPLRDVAKKVQSWGCSTFAKP